MARAGRRASRGALVLMTLACWPALVACGGDASSADASQQADTGAVRGELVSLFAHDHSTQSAECFADALLDQVSLTQLRTGGVLDEQLEVNLEVTALDQTAAEAWTDAQLACTDFIAESTKAQVTLTHGKLNSSAFAACLDERLDPETIRAATIAALMAAYSGSALEDLSVAQSVCSQTSLPRT